MGRLLPLTACLALLGCAPPAQPVAQDPTPVRFAALGDAGKGNADQARNAEALAAVCARQGCDLVLLLGDNVYPDGVTSLHDPRWQTAFEQPFAPVDAPFYPVLGNHDLGPGGLEAWRGDVQVAWSADHPRWRLPARYHRHRRGAVDFLALDTPAFMLAGLGNPLIDTFAERARAQERWIDESTASPASWRIAYGHHPLRSNGRHGDAGAYEGVPGLPLVSGGGVREALTEHLCGRVDLYLSGHDHNQQWLTEPCAGTELIVSGAGSSTSPLRGDHPVRFQDDRLEGFVWIELVGPVMRVQFWNRDGELLHEGAIRRP